MKMMERLSIFDLLSTVRDRRYRRGRYDGNPLRAIFSICSQKRSNSPSVV
jgi:hypothetical protein